MVIWGLVSLFLTAVVRRQRLRSGRTASLYIGFVPSTVVYGGYLWAVIPDGTAWSVFLALVAGQLYGFPLSLACAEPIRYCAAWWYLVQVAVPDDTPVHGTAIAVQSREDRWWGRSR